jgi:hypothetical protein
MDTPERKGTDCRTQTHLSQTRKKITFISIDFMRLSGQIELESVELLGADEVEREWKFEE